MIDGSATLAQVSFSNGIASGQAPVNKVGALLLSEGLAVLEANSMDIQGKVQNGPKQVQLHGQTFKTNKDGNGIEGEVFFSTGPGLATLDSNNCDEFVKLENGSTVSGAITNVLPNGIECARKFIPMNEVKEVHSARVFIFSGKLDGKDEMTFKSTCVKVRNRKGGGIPVSFFVGATVVAVTTCAIVLPIVIPAAVRHHHHHKLNTRATNNYVFLRRSVRVRSRSTGGIPGLPGIFGSSSGGGPGA